MKRRTILKAGAGLSPLLSLSALAAFPGGQKKSAQVLVIGAGIAGLAAAKQLRDAGIDVIVLEARDRTGGRIHTYANWRGPALDIGASWIHGAGPANPIAKLARKIGARTVTTEYEKAELYNGDGSALNSRDEKKIDSIRKEVNQAIAEQSRRGPDSSLRKLVYAETDYETRSALEQRIIDFTLNSNFEHDYSGSADQLSRLWFDDGSSYTGDEVLFPDGYRVITNALAEDLDIRLRHEVTAIHYGEKEGVSIETTQGVFTASSVIVTLPLGVLKAGNVQFTPALPLQKQAAIGQLGFGVLNKCCLLFPETFWNKNLDWLNHLPRTGHAGEWVEWVSFARPTGKPVLMGFNAAEFGSRIEAWSDEKIIRSAVSTLSTMFGKPIAMPLDAVITRWNSDPFARGSYSFNAVGSTPAQRDDLARNVAGKVFFAGEATEKKYYQTVHGAYQSGLRAAGEILKQKIRR
ncbi:flavin monoamine oxidase family protein [Undibacterium luofuense]|uniref:Tryptophan 2-monooxygenase n=1 Tax=Undibacterium luofuense TaxID=2828733 RepID=A0A941I7B5_9BURK|nr:FAD-dependent oxidoreductase [Undibacterium luofuense]MBR7781673.1 FAD-dependent oxidoreductase [Undibacterium luofuense]